MHSSGASPLNNLSNDTSAADEALRLIDCIEAYPSVVVAFSGGVDSAVVAAAAYRALGNRAVAWTSQGAAVPESDRVAARAIASEIGIRHVEIQTSEIENPRYVQNDVDRCFHCKTTLYGSIREWANAQGFATILSGTNADDLQDYRPGLKAAENWQVVAPLAQLGIGKERVRAIAEHWGMEVATKPASPCLSSRIAYGQIVTLGRLKSIESMERWLAANGFQDVRARLHAEGLLRIEIAAEQIDALLQPGIREAIVEEAQRLGFRYVTLDLEGRNSGSMNRVLSDSSKQTEPTGDGQ